MTPAPQPPGPEPLLAGSKVHLRGLGKSFATKNGPLEVLKAIDLSVQAGEFLCFVGPSGCGKSTLLNIIGGFDAPTAGSATIDGEPVKDPDPRRVFVFQEYGIFPWATVWDNVALGLRKRSRQEQASIVRHYVDLVGLEGFEQSYPSELSGGMKQRVAVARALAVSPDIILMDEPLGALDSLTRLQIRAEIFRVWRAERATILYVTHDVDEALQLADRIVVLTPRPGRIAEIVTVGIPHPRDFGSAEYGRAKVRLLDLLGVSHAM